jgi:NTE family protein
MENIKNILRRVFMDKSIIILFCIICLYSTTISFARENEEKVVGIALSGGAAWGLAHIGVLEVLLENNIKIHVISGTSMGAIVGAFYAGGTKPQEMIDMAQDTNWTDFIRPVISELGFFSIKRIEKFLKDELKINEFSDLEIPLSVVATNLNTGEEVIFNEGAISPAISASAAIPIIFEPVQYKGELLMDGGLVNYLPVNLLEDMGADIKIGVNVAGAFSFTGTPESKIEAGIRSYNILQKDRINPEEIDVLIEADLSGIRGIDFNSYEEIIEEGRRAAKEALPNLKEVLGEKE